MPGTLIAKKTVMVTREQLATLSTPVPLGPKHYPIRHAELVRTIDAEVARRGYRECGTMLALSKNGHKIFGVIDLEPVRGANPEVAPALGFRAANDQTLALRMVAGARVMVCDNLALMGDMIAMHRMHTLGLDLPDEISRAFDRFVAHSGILADHITRLAASAITDDQARALAFQVFADGVLPVHMLDDVNRFYFEPAADATDCQPRTSWSLHNAFTRAMRELTPPRQFTATIALAQYFGMVSQSSLPFGPEA